MLSILFRHIEHDQLIRIVFAVIIRQTDRICVYDGSIRKVSHRMLMI